MQTIKSIKLIIGEVSSLSTSFIAAIGAWQEQLDWLFRILASVIAIIAGICSIYFSKKRNKEKLIK